MKGKTGRPSLSDLKPKRCLKCGKGLRDWNKSNYCESHKYIYYRKTEEGKEKHRLNVKRYVESHKEKIIEYAKQYAKQYYNSHKDYFKIYYQKNKERIDMKKKEWNKRKREEKIKVENFSVTTKE